MGLKALGSSFAAGVVLVSLLLCAGVALADARPARAWLSWQAPEGCATPTELQAKLAILTQRPVVWAAEGESHRFSIIVVARRVETSWQARVELRDTGDRSLGVREVTSRTDDCRELDVPLALVIATLLDGLWDQLLQPTAAAEPRVRPLLGAAVGVVFGLSRNPWLSAGLRLELPWALPLALTANVYPPAERSDALGRGARYLGASAGVGVCPALWRASGVSLKLCTGLQAGAIWARGIGLTERRAQALPLVFLGFEPALELPLWSDVWVAQAALLGGWTVVRPRFEWSISATRASLQPEPLLLGAQISLMGRLP